MEKYKSLHRATIGEMGNIPHSGIYIVAYMGKVMYIGRAIESVVERLKNHICQGDRLGGWLRNVDGDWNNIRLDVLETPDIENGKGWLDLVEDKLIKKFQPLFNVLGNR